MWRRNYKALKIFFTADGGVEKMRVIKPRLKDGEESIVVWFTNEWPIHDVFETTRNSLFQSIDVDMLCY